MDVFILSKAKCHFLASMWRFLNQHFVLSIIIWRRFRERPGRLHLAIYTQFIWLVAYKRNQWLIAADFTWAHFLFYPMWSTIGDKDLLIGVLLLCDITGVCIWNYLDPCKWTQKEIGFSVEPALTWRLAWNGNHHYAGILWYDLYITLLDWKSVRRTVS